MKRRTILTTLAGASMQVRSNEKACHDLQNPYEQVDWESCVPVHSMSHQHQGTTDGSRDGFREMGYGHFAFSNYYPSAPTYPLPAEYSAKHPELIAAPNAEHHSFTDSGLHANALGSMLATGYGSTVRASDYATSPVLHDFTGLNVFQSERPWLGVYRLDIQLATTSKHPSEASLTIDGALECDFRRDFVPKGNVEARKLTAGSHSIYLRTVAQTIHIELRFDTVALQVTQLRLMQGTNRAWREVFLEAFSALQYPDGGGITLNHPTGKVKDYLPMLDFDPRVLGIEVWNQLTSGFGSSRGFYDHSGEPCLHFYNLWDAILRTGRRCWGFFVKDHNTFERGRNILLLPDLTGLSASERERAALVAYRKGNFFGSVAAMAVDAQGKVVAPYDRSEFRFSGISVVRDASGRASAIRVTIAGHDHKMRPNVIIRFITDKGIAHVVTSSTAAFALKRTSTGELDAAFVRIEAFAAPTTHLQGKPLAVDMLGQMNVHDISLLHDHMTNQSRKPGGALRTPVPIVDMIFSQAMLREV